MPLSSRWQLWVRGREGPPLPQSALPGPRASEYERHSSFNLQWSATVQPPSMARGPPRSNVSGMLMSSLASPSICMRASCHLRTSCRVGIGCDSLSAAALQIKSQEPSLLGIFYYPPAPPKGDLMLLARSSPDVCSIPLTLHSTHIFRGLAAQRDCSFLALRSFLTTALQSQTRPEESLSGCLCPDSLFGAAVSSFVDADTVRIPVVPPFSVQSLLCFAVFRGVIGAFRQTAPSSLTASSLRCLILSRLLRHHFGTHLAPAAGLSRFNLSGILLLLDCQCKRRSELSTPLEPHSVRRLPRPTALPAHILRDSVRFAPRDSQDVEPNHTDARPSVVPEITGITRAEGSYGI